MLIGFSLNLDGQSRRTFILCFTAQILIWGTAILSSGQKALKVPTRRFGPSVGVRVLQPISFAHSGSQAETWVDQFPCCAFHLSAQ